MYGNIYPDTAWEIERQGCATSSEFHKLLTPGKRKMTKEELKARPKKGAGSKTTTIEDPNVLSEVATTYVLEKVSELLTGTVRQFTSNSTDWGNDMEPRAVEELRKRHTVLEYFGNDNKKFFKLSKYSGGSPDAISGRVVFEIKCPENPANHVKNLLLTTQQEFKELHDDYYVQLQKNMMCVAKALGIPFEDMTGVFVSYCPLMIKPEHQLKELEVTPDLELRDKILVAVDTYETNLRKYINTLMVESEEPTVPEEEILHTSEDLKPDFESAKQKIEKGKMLRKAAGL